MFNRNNYIKTVCSGERRYTKDLYMYFSIEYVGLEVTNSVVVVVPGSNPGQGQLSLC